MSVANQPSIVLNGRYRLDAPLGQRSDGWMCEAHDLVLGRPVIVKMFKSVVDEAAAPTFAEQIKSLAGLRHPHLVALYDGGMADGHPFLVMEPVDGVDLLDGTNERPVSAADIATLGAGLAEALARIHAAGFIHGELTSASVLIDASRRWRLVGFGVARPQDGTAAADVHALGLVLLNCLNGPDRDGGNEAIPGPLARVLAAMTCRNPERRPSAAVSAQRLSQVADTLRAGPSSPSAAALRWGRVAGLAAAGGLVAAAAIALVPTSVPHQTTQPVAAPAPTPPGQLPVPGPTATPGRPVSYPTQATKRPPTAGTHPTTSASPTTSAPPTTSTQPPPVSADPTTTDTPPGLIKKPLRLPPGLFKKLFGTEHDDWGWPFD